MGQHLDIGRYVNRVVHRLENSLSWHITAPRHTPKHALTGGGGRPDDG